MVSCQSNDSGSYHISGIAWIILIVISLAMFFIFVLKKGVAEDGEENKNSDSSGISHSDFEPMGSYLGGHPASDNIITNTAFKKNSDCCMFFYKDHSYNLPEFKFKIKIKSIKNISVEDLSSIEKKLTSGDIDLTVEAAKAMKKKKIKPQAFITIDWTDGQVIHSTLFSFKGKDAMKKATNARDSFLRMVN